MSKSRHNKYIDTIDECLTNGVNNGIFQISIEDEILNGRHITIKGKKVVNFGSCSYLGLEMDERMREGSKKAIDMYGTQFSASRLFASCGLYKTAENLLSEVFFNKPVIISPTTTLAHIAAIPILVEDDDLIILDHQVHGSVQMAAQLPKSRGVRVELIKHNNLDQLEEIINQNRNKYNKIWHFIDGLYSMYGDYAPIHDLIKLLNKYDNLYLYADDAHGMSWTGKNGTGYLMSQVELHPKMVLSTSLNKAFASGGGLLVFPNYEMKRKILTCGSSFTFSGPLQPAQLGAIIESAKIHLSDEIYTLQNQLNKRTQLALNLIKEYKLPLMAPTESPIFYLPLGLPRVGYNMVKRLLNDGFYTNIGIFPGVPVKCTGLRLAINNGQTLEDIQNVLEAYNYHFPKVLDEEGQSIDDIEASFKMNFPETGKQFSSYKKGRHNTKLIIQHETSIKNIDKNLWNELLGDNGSFDWNGCKILEESFKDNPEPECNWNFNYLIIKDENQKPLLATFFTELLCKDDLISPASVSEELEEIRKKDKYYLTSKVIMMGSLLTEGEHLYLDKSTPKWKDAMLEMIRIMNEVKLKSGASAVQLRDFDSNDAEIRDFLINEGFIKVEMPEAQIVENLEWSNYEEYLKTISYRSRKHVQKYMIKKEHLVDINFLDPKDVTPNTIDECYNLYLNVKRQSHNINTFDLPKKLFANILKDTNWETLQIKIKNSQIPVSFVFCYKTAKRNYCPTIVGLNYDVNDEYSGYRQTLFQLTQRASKKKYHKLYLGMDASIEKKKVGAKIYPKSVYIQADNNFNMELISLLKKTKN